MGSIEYMIESDIHPTILRNDITSPGGTSANALYILEKEGFRNTRQKQFGPHINVLLRLKMNQVKIPAN